LQDQVMCRSDSREALAAFCAHYWKELEWIERMRHFVGKQLDTLDDFSQWRTHDQQFHAELKKALTIRQFEPVARWYRTQNRPTE
ncbi:MAG: hypothetical protein ACJ79A_15860, partial [Gemmatimonadaceae bacterium]